ncbi:response regulator transcription factor [Motiliproteus sp. MSK22-1]|uniref:response regulator transcription factor n=1 Tax=Motiliproteus sp. MSK22-1 TaxID=1897630 RepID=UPI000977A7C9|nr:response regulator transcription factor [Motiliproteus sp. MSK22-1]OMH31789.1 hypothetical protein BGP75_16880 [Motiliproteus sp. MSK22-1]
MRILWIESDAVFSKQQAKRLSGYDYFVDTVIDEQKAVGQAREGRYELAVYDLSFQKEVSWELIKSLLEFDIPVVLIIDRKDTQLQINAVEQGVEEIILRPVRGEDLVARLRAVIRHRVQISHHRLESSGLILDESRYEVIDERQRIIALTRTELVLLRFLMTNSDKAVSKEVLLKVLYQSGQERVSNVVEVYIRMLRKKLGRDRIRTVWGRGYLLCAGGSTELKVSDTLIDD